MLSKGHIIRGISLSFIAALAVCSFCLYLFLYFAAYGAIEARLTDFAKEFNAKNTESQIQNFIVKQNSTFTIQILDFETSKPYFKKQDHCYRQQPSQYSWNDKMFRYGKISGGFDVDRLRRICVQITIR